MEKNNNGLFALADKLRDLMAEREDAVRIVKEIDAEIVTAKSKLFDVMRDTDTSNLTRGGVRFYLTSPRSVPVGLGVRKTPECLKGVDDNV